MAGCLVWPAVLIAASLAGAGEPLGTAQNPVRMMFVPSGEAQTILKGGEEIARQLHQITGLHFKTAIATSYAAVIEAMGAGKVDIGWLATLSYVLAKQKYDVDLLLIVVRFGSPFYRGQIVTRVDSGIQTLADLKGKKFAFVDPASTSGHLYPKTLLLSKGLNPDRLFSQTRFAGSHNAVILSVLKGEVDAGATYDDARAAVAKMFPEVYQKIKVVAYTRDIPNDTVSARKGLDPALRKKIKDGLMRLSKTPEGSKVLKRVYGISGLMDFDAFFDPVREAGRLLQLDIRKEK
ncbi:MAG: phosphate/phosphite/phosphonate ABC transporter substrate-binding protein [Nitrospinaceae bacterium]|nr:phosphate/phosphite/phosphonate ABC transporter substrate-binding protein [Nitrospinaceae bacterium]NIR55816.1 phosphate/phosphite/phosphonate ABC transporter substrate-binding protein [Nitrospinaceae bacterium]NIS86269.1 phosphate/phosphite/phosphonate ABC transporter substrate-binding protein [Nitrospinaceae bacterium]NIT83098.1 phosphate/phosphite/phosphonate ABC transporter substrate-binding protein [Nitrospinaceae bacterium]NIU45308.1 phosphate/phosphite/phosphonate ABC transporter subs